MYKNYWFFSVKLPTDKHYQILTTDNQILAIIITLTPLAVMNLAANEIIKRYIAKNDR